MGKDEILTRIEGLGLRGAEHADPKATIRAARGVAQEDAREESLRSRELPTISIDLGDPPPESGETAARDLEVLGVLGEGGMGRVFVARQHSLDREVAIKSLHADADERARAALLEEGAVTGHLEHPGIIPVHALGVDVASRPVLVMKRVEGVSWRELLEDPAHPFWSARGGEPSRRLDDHLEILMQVCNAVCFAHSRGVVHRDIKPENVLIGRFADVYLADWGLAFRMRDAAADRPSFCGTPAYMAPEMVLGGAIDERTDVYLLGATLHEILTGEPRHRGRGTFEVVQAATESRPYEYRPKVPPALARIANKATARDPKDRHRDAAELRAALSEYLRHQSSLALAESGGERLAAVRALLAQGADRAQPEVQRELDLLVTEARFALTQAIEQWGENPGAKDGLRELDEVLAARHARAAELERLAREHDPGSGSRARLFGQVVLVLVGIGLSASAFVRGVDYEPTARDLVLESFAPLVVVAGVAIALAKRLFRTAFNRRVLLCALAAVGGIAIGRVLAWRAGLAVHEMLVYDSLLAAASSLVSAASTFRGLVWIAAGMLLTAAACAMWPAHAFFAFSVGTAACLLAMPFMRAPSRMASSSS